jgi:hypothetical protein
MAPCRTGCRSSSVLDASPSGAGKRSWRRTCSRGSNSPSRCTPADVPVCAGTTPALLGRGATPRDELASPSRAGAAGDGAPLAPAGLAAPLVVALPEADWAATFDAGRAGLDQSALRREPALGHGTHPRRIAHARPRRWQRLHRALPVASCATATEPGPWPRSCGTTRTRSGRPTCSRSIRSPPAHGTSCC